MRHSEKEMKQRLEKLTDEKSQQLIEELTLIEEITDEEMDGEMKQRLEGLITDICEDTPSDAAINAANEIVRGLSEPSYTALVNVFANGEFGGLEDHSDWVLINIPLSSVAAIEDLSSFIKQTKGHANGAEVSMPYIDTHYLSDDGTIYDEVSMDWTPKISVSGGNYLNLIHSAKHSDIEKICTGDFSIPANFMRLSYKDLAGEHNTTSATIEYLIKHDLPIAETELASIPSEYLGVAERSGVILLPTNRLPLNLHGDIRIELFNDLLHEVKGKGVSAEDFENIYDSAYVLTSPEGGMLSTAESIEEVLIEREESAKARAEENDKALAEDLAEDAASEARMGGLGD